MHGSTLAQYCYYLAPTVHRDLSEERQQRHTFQCVRVVLLCMELCLLYTECQLVMSTDAWQKSVLSALSFLCIVTEYHTMMRNR